MDKVWSGLYVKSVTGTGKSYGSKGNQRGRRRGACGAKHGVHTNVSMLRDALGGREKEEGDRGWNLHWEAVSYERSMWNLL
jgi:hypothetical protein